MLIVAPADGWDSLVSLADADAYHARMGNDAWALADESKREAALRRAAQYLSAKRIRAQYLDPVHERVKAAASEAAARALDGGLYADIPAQAVTSESVGPISVSYAAPANGGRARFTVIDDLLLGLTESAQGHIPLVRA